MIECLTCNLLRGHIARFAPRGRAKGTVGFARNAKIGKATDAIDAHQYVLWRYVTMNEL
jgi:hypothetical protein